MVIKRSIQIVIAVMVIIIGAMDIMAIEEAKYKVLQKENGFEIRDYAPHILAETILSVCPLNGVRPSHGNPANTKAEISNHYITKNFDSIFYLDCCN